MNKLICSLLILTLGISVSSAFNVLAFWATTNDQAHTNFYKEANKWFPEHGSANGFTYKSTSNWNDLNENNLKNYQLVVFLDDVPEGSAQRQAFQHYMENGGGWIGFHASAFNTNANKWSWFYNTFLGTGAFKGNTWWPTAAKLHNDAPNHPAMKGLGTTFQSSKSEWYSWHNDLRQNANIEVLATLDNSSFPQGTTEQWHSGYYPIIWSNKKFKMIYANFGHNYMDYQKDVGLSSTFDSNDQNKFLFNAFHYLSGQ